MKTVRDVADEAGVSVQTVYRRLNAVKQKSNDVLTEKAGNTAYFTDVGYRLILESLTSVKQMEKSVNHSESDEVLFLRGQIAILNEQIERLTKLNENNQILLLNQQKLLPPPKVSWWRRLFRRGGDHSDPR